MAETYLKRKNKRNGAGTENQFDEKNIETLCMNYALKYHHAKGVLFISTGTGNWRILYDGDSIMGVYHESIKKCNSSIRTRFECGYHNQYLDYETIEDVLRYICIHDKASFRAYTRTNRKIDNLFQQISAC